MKPAPWFLAAIFAVVTSTALPGERPTAEELLSAYQKSVEQLAQARIECVEKHPERELGENARVAETHERTITRDGLHWKVAHVTRMVRTVNGTKQEGGFRQELIVGEQQLLEVGQTPNGIVQVFAWLDPTKVKKTEIGAQVFSIDPTRLHWRALGGAETLFGRFEDDADQPLWDVMREASLELLPETAKIDGAETYVLKSVGKFGEHTVWIDPAQGSLPRRIEIRKKLGNLLDGNQLGSRIGSADESPRIPGRGAPSSQPPDIRAFSARVDKIKIENKEGVFVMTAWTAEERITFGNGKIGERRSQHSVSAVDFNPKTWPKDAFRPGIEIADKTSVRVHDGMTGTEYEWVDGKVQIRGGN